MQTRLFILILALCNWKYASGSFTPCRENSLDFNQCLEDGLNKLIPTLRHGWTNEELPGLDPISVPPVNTSRVDGDMDITLSTKDVTISGLADSRVYAVKTKNLYMGKLEIVLKAPTLVITGLYDSEGEIATFPLSSDGHFNITMDDVTVVCIIYLDRFKIGREGRFRVTSISVDAVPGQIHVKPAPYLDGDVKLGQIMEVYLNENAYELYKMIKIPLMNYMSNLAKIMINSYMTQVPDNEIIAN